MARVALVINSLNSRAPTTRSPGTCSTSCTADTIAPVSVSASRLERHSAVAGIRVPFNVSVTTRDLVQGLDLVISGRAIQSQREVEDWHGHPSL